jgi:O-methyltransferase
MKIPYFQLINYSLILIVLILFIRYMWDIFFDNNYQPDEWQQALKNKRIPPGLRKLEKNYADKVRFFAWWFQVMRITRENIPGSFAELGVYKGESAKILHQMAPDRKFHLFDTFGGFSEDDLENETGEAATYTKKNFADTSVGKVIENINGNENILLHPGHFPETAEELSDERFALVNIDADLHDPVKAGLEFFYPRLSPGGVLFIHDYNYKWEGLKRAVDDFSGHIPENPVMIPDMNGTILIVKHKKV